MPEFSFLTAGPRYQVDLPQDLAELPELVAPLATRHLKYFFRAFVFVPTRFDGDSAEECRDLGTLFAPSGHAVELTERVGTPPQWYLRWQLSAGALYTHLREEDGPDQAAPIVESLRIDEDVNGLPLLLPDPPLGRGVQDRPGYEESATFRSISGQGLSVILRRPGYVAEGKVVTDPNVKSGVALRGGTIDDIEVLVLASDEATSTAGDVMDSALKSFSRV